MRRASILLGLTLVALAATARAQDGAPAATTPGPPAAQPAASQRRLQFGLAFLPMGLGRFSASPGGMSVTADAAFAFGVGLSASYVVRPGLTVGIAPQAIFNVKAKEDGNPGAKQYDIMARLAYAFPVVDTISVYAEVLPGYSLISPPNGDTAKGLVLAFGAGGAMDLTDRVFSTLGVGYELGFQKLSGADVKTNYLRLALGGGVKF